MSFWELLTQTGLGSSIVLAGGVLAVLFAAFGGPRRKR